MAFYCGIDFGTSNSVVTILRDTDPEPMAVIREPSLLFFPEDPESAARRFCGNKALEEYISGGMKGRFFQSVKTVLPDVGFTFTRVNGKPLSAEDLVAVMIRSLRERAEEVTGTSISRVVMGRPARFSTDEEKEQTAQERLAAAVSQAGIGTAIFELEPVGGAYAYAAGKSRRTERPDGPEKESISPRTVFVADHGGGTSDFTVMRMGRDKTGRPAAQEILATHGIRAGGDDFDGAIMWNRLVDQFGHGSSFESFGKLLPVPVHIFHIISRWDQIHFLKTLSYREELKSYLRSSNNPLAIRRLIMLVEEDLGYFIFRAIEAAKIGLSDAPSASVRYQHGKLRLDELLTREQFCSYIARDLERIDEAIRTTVERAGAPRINEAFLTGGSSRVPAIRTLLQKALPEARLITDADQFQSVSLGLALQARDRGLAN